MSLTASMEREIDTSQVYIGYLHDIIRHVLLAVETTVRIGEA